MAKATNPTIINNGDGSYTCGCTSDVRAKLAYEGIQTHAEVTGPQWKLTTKAKGSFSPTDRQMISGEYTKGFLVDETGTHPIDIEEPPE